MNTTVNTVMLTFTMQWLQAETVILDSKNVKV